MIVVSMSDFLKSPAQYVERAKHTAVMLEGSDVTLSRTKPRFFAAVSNFFKPKPRQLGIGRGQMKLEWVGDGKVTPEELFDDVDDLSNILTKQREG